MVSEAGIEDWLSCMVLRPSSDPGREKAPRPGGWVPFTGPGWFCGEKGKSQPDVGRLTYVPKTWLASQGQSKRGL